MDRGKQRMRREFKGFDALRNLGVPETSTRATL
jgi:hypothetical protein